jgi:hypothetical protein
MQSLACSFLELRRYYLAIAEYIRMRMIPASRLAAATFLDSLDACDADLVPLT